ncbi:hypothetical protein [Defluviitalea raffinosedens]|uniref:hypothetical protein n=1 Tax=Defluviitalea raffinosedens TaxID=1450156 RepID=UPI00195B9664|nr:hypothetical protein [Defluviitalea raffinosedens]MBM7685883.1 hypothetical protein [Defluviitalea raffinosedens]
MSESGVDEPITYCINPKEFKTGEYEYYLNAYDEYGNLLETTSREKIKIINPFVVKSVTPATVDLRGNIGKYIEINGNGFDQNTTVEIIDGSDANQCQSDVVSEKLIKLPMPDCIKNAANDKTVTVRIKDGGFSYDFNIQVIGKSSNEVDRVLKKAAEIYLEFDRKVECPYYSDLRKTTTYSIDGQEYKALTENDHIGFIDDNLLYIFLDKPLKGRVVRFRIEEGSSLDIMWEVEDGQEDNLIISPNGTECKIVAKKAGTYTLNMYDVRAPESTKKKCLITVKPVDGKVINIESVTLDDSKINMKVGDLKN